MLAHEEFLLLDDTHAHSRRHAGPEWNLQIATLFDEEYTKFDGTQASVRTLAFGVRKGDEKSKHKLY